jgi:type IV/VI secretion system ImpK/VasF family protein
MVESQIVELNSHSSSYYRSHLYTSYHGINPLITAAHPLLSIIDRLQLSRNIKADGNFYNNLQYELKVFQNRAINANYDEETVFIAHYLLSASINEKIHDQKSFNTFNKLMPPQKEHNETTENSPDEQFFVILDTIIDKPDHYLDLLELIYLCLSLGFEGKYKNKAHQKLKAIMENLYQTITSRRNNQQAELFEQSTKEELPVPSSYHWSIWLVITAFLIGSTFMASNWYLDHTAQAIMSPHQ